MCVECLAFCICVTVVDATIITQLKWITMLHMHLALPFARQSQSLFTINTPVTCLTILIDLSIWIRFMT